jgi:2-hydroxychromene-2-carboxylate isomerase
MNMSRSIDFYFDFSSPYGYFGSEKIEALAAKHGRAVNWHAILLGVVFKRTGSIPLTQVPIKGDYSRRDFSRSARFHGVEGFRMPSIFPIATQAPARIVLWLKTHDLARVPAVVHGLYRAFFTEDADISKPDVAAAVASRSGANEAEVRAAIDDPAVKDGLKSANEQAIAAGVFGSPFTIVDGEPFWGVDRFDQIDRWLATGGW